jgi:CrcB protein
MPNFLLVLLGGAAGAGLRYETGRLALRQFGPGFPWGTLLVNLLGGLAMGVLVGFMAGEGMTSRPAWFLLGVGVLGGFTTFSAYSLDLFLMLQRGQAGLALAYGAGSALGALAFLALGCWATRAVL